MDSALYKGKVFHQRFTPKQHRFTYRIFLFWLNLEEIEQVAQRVRGFSFRKWRPFQFKRSDYLGDPEKPLAQAVRERMIELGAQPISGKVFLLGQVRMFGCYFSPVNFYYWQDEAQQEFRYLLAEVSNTPWNERHHYLVDLAEQADCQKAFHVSPFNPMDMTYKWRIAQPGKQLALSLECHKDTRHFVASLQLHKQILNSRALLNVMLSIPSMTIKTIGGIYWQAIKLFFKGVPVHDHPASNRKS